MIACTPVESLRECWIDKPSEMRWLATIGINTKVPKTFVNRQCTWLIGKFKALTTFPEMCHQLYILTDRQERDISLWVDYYYFKEQHALFDTSVYPSVSINENMRDMLYLGHDGLGKIIRDDVSYYYRENGTLRAVIWHINGVEFILEAGNEIDKSNIFLTKLYSTSEKDMREAIKLFEVVYRLSLTLVDELVIVFVLITIIAVSVIRFFNLKKKRQQA
jgi:hypothetical protein